MLLTQTYSPEFDALMERMQAKYPKQLFDMDGIGDQLDMAKFSKKFFSVKTTADASIDANANVDDMSVIAYAHELPKPYFRLNSYYMLWKQIRKMAGIEKANEAVERNLTGDIYINDFHGIGAGQAYCFNYSTYDIMVKGLPMIQKIKSVPPKHLYSFKSQLEQFTIIAANSTLGATGLADLLVVMSHYVEKALRTLSDAHFYFRDQASVWSYVKETLVSFIYTINQPMRGNQSCFTNISIYDKYFLENMLPDYLFPDGSTPDIAIVQKLQDLFLSIMNEEMQRTPITFPVTTACFAVNDDHQLLDRKFLGFIAEHNRQFGFINIYVGKSSTLSSCCRLRSNKESEYFNSFGSGSSKIGSLGVCTINLPKLHYQYKDMVQLEQELIRLVELCGLINHAKRQIILKRINNGNQPLYSLGFMELKRQYSTVGINGFNEAIELAGLDPMSQAGIDYGLFLIDTINMANDRMAKHYKFPHNTEQIPGESVSIKLAAKDRLLGFQDQYTLYSNQFIPLVAKADLLDRMRLQGVYDGHFSGGAICHLNVETEVRDSKQIEALIEAAARMGVVYFAINYNLQECENGHMSVGRGETCSMCGKPIINNYTRVVGFLTNTKNWHKVRRELDYPNRQFYGGDQV